MKPQYNIEADETLHIFFEEDLYLEERPQFHDSIEFIFMTDGKVIAHLEEKQQEIVPGDIFFVESYETHHYEMQGNIKAIVLVLSREYIHDFRNLYKGLTFDTFLKDHKKNEKIIKFVIDWMNQENKTRLYNQGCVNILFSLLLDAYPLIKRHDYRGDVFLKEILRYIHLHYLEDITLSSMAHDLGFTVEHCSRTLAKALGCNFRTYINNLRLRKVFELEKENHSGLTQQEILFRCGFKSPATYFRVRKSTTDDKSGK